MSNGADCKDRANDYASDVLADASRIRITEHPLWSRPVSSQGPVTVAAAGSTVVVGDSGGVFALDANTGRETWRRTGVGATITVTNGAVYVGSPQRGMLALRLRDGSTVWKTRDLCVTAPNAVEVTQQWVFVACPRIGRLAVLDAASGSKRIARNVLLADAIDEAPPLGFGTAAVAGTSDGASLTRQLVLVRMSDLSPVGGAANRRHGRSMTTLAGRLTLQPSADGLGDRELVPGTALR